MIKYSDLVNYIKENHINWNSDLFDILKGFFNNYYTHQFHNVNNSLPTQQEIIFPAKEFNPPADGEYSTEDVINLFNT